MKSRTIKRLMAKIEVDPKTKCWNWTGGNSGTGYGRVWANGRKQPAHRVFYKLFRGKIPAGFQIDHVCRNKGCQNPAHLEIVTVSENLHRRPPLIGQLNGAAKLTENQVREIRESKETQVVLGARYGVTPGTIWKARSGYNWKHI